METTKKTKSSKESKAAESGTKRTWRAKPILSQELTEDPPLCQVYVGLLKDKRDISAAIPAISSAIPGFHHLKRCSCKKLLLAALKRSKLITDMGGEVPFKEHDHVTEEELKSILREKGFDISMLEERFEVVSVPSRAPRTKAQAVRASVIWPVNFHPEPNIEKLIDGSIFEEHQLEAIGNYMRLVIEAARLEAVGSSDCNGAAVIIDPRDGAILAMAASKMDLHPMWHASMIAIDLVARLQGGGAWDLSDSKNLNFIEHTFDAGEVKKKIFKRKHEQQEEPLCYPESLSELWRHSSSTWESRSLDNEGKANPTSGARTKCSSSLSIDDHLLGSIKTDGANPEKSGPYLCTGYWAFLFKEPCPLCAMALLHSRILRIFYSLPNEKTGILGTNGILHALPALNHRYQVWSGILEEESREAAQIIEQRDISSPSDTNISALQSTSLKHAFSQAGQPFDR